MSRPSSQDITSVPILNQVDATLTQAVNKVLSIVGAQIVPSGYRPPAGQDSIRFAYFVDRFRDIQNVPGCIVECGVASGQSVAYFLAAMRYFGQERDVLGFDTYSGFKGVDLSKGDLGHDGYLAYSEESVWKVLRWTGLPLGNVSLVKGDVRETTKGFDKPIALLHIDLDIYDPCRCTLENLYDKVAPGGLVLFDEYEGKWAGARKAIDESGLSVIPGPLGRAWHVKPA